MGLPRTLRRTEPELTRDVPVLLARVAWYEVDEMVRATAAGYPEPDLRSLDAIHLATAHAVFGGRLAAFVSYDRRLLASAAALGMPVHAPARG